jgi:hypothetical protein
VNLDPGDQRRAFLLQGSRWLGMMGVFVGWPISPDLTSFVPRVMAALETSMWRRYYEKHYILLFYNLFLASRHVNFSPVASVNIAVKAASAAYLFQISRSRSEAQQALPALKKYFSTISAGSPSPYSATEAAKLELDWWQARREFSAPEDYGKTIGQVASLIYGNHQADMTSAGILRATAMTYRDRCGSDITQSDWERIEETLGKSYALLKTSINSSLPK